MKSWVVAILVLSPVRSSKSRKRISLHSSVRACQCLRRSTQRTFHKFASFVRSTSLGHSNVTFACSRLRTSATMTKPSRLSRKPTPIASAARLSRKTSFGWTTPDGERPTFSWVRRQSLFVVTRAISILPDVSAYLPTGELDGFRISAKRSRRNLFARDCASIIEFPIRSDSDHRLMSHLGRNLPLADLR